MKTQEAENVARLLVEEVFVKFGIPLQIRTDQGPNFESRLFKELCELMSVDKLRTTRYKPSANGLIERFHRTLNAMLGKVVGENHRDWDSKLPFVVAAYRATEHEVTK